MALIEDLCIYPLKSARGIPLAEARLGSGGLEWDRNWMAVDAHGKFISQRTRPRLARITPKLTDSQLQLQAEDMRTLQLPLAAPEGTLRAVRIWDDSCVAHDQGDEAADWVSDVIGAPARIVRVPEKRARLADSQYSGPYPIEIAFPDGFPLLICNRASLDALNRRMPEPIPMERFRPNIVVTGLAEFAEDNIDLLQIGPVTLRLVKPCTRCIITSTDQRTGERSTNPLPVLREFRFDRILSGVKFGENAIIVRGAGETVRRGAPCAAVTAEPDSTPVLTHNTLQKPS